MIVSCFVPVVEVDGDDGEFHLLTICLVVIRSWCCLFMAEKSLSLRCLCVGYLL